MIKLIIFIDSLFNKLADILLWIIFAAFIIGAVYISYRVRVEITKQAIIESTQNKK